MVLGGGALVVEAVVAEDGGMSADVGPDPHADTRLVLAIVEETIALDKGVLSLGARTSFDEDAVGGAVVDGTAARVPGARRDP